ncbi:MAG: GYD domain-containing protein [Gemmatimonadales bacterium]|nr:GYD domain-containing protein [Gemmatimonadales bacterium]
MPTYIMLSNLTDEGAKTLKANPKRLQEVNKEIEKFGAKVTAQYAVLGPYDFVSIMECPDNETIARVSVELASRGTVHLLTLPAVPIANFVRNLKP